MFIANTALGEKREKSGVFETGTEGSSLGDLLTLSKALLAVGRWDEADDGPADVMAGAGGQEQPMVPTGRPGSLWDTHDGLGRVH